MTDTNITICNGALARLGVSSISDFTSNDKAKICGAIYPKFSNTLLAMHVWRFARKKSASLTSSTAPTYGRTYAFALPSDYLTMVNVYNSATTNPLAKVEYEIFGAKLHTDFDTAYIDYIYTVDEDHWPDWYQDFVSTALASVLAFPITEDQQKEVFYRQIAFGTPQENGEGGLYKRCKGIDARQQPIKPFNGQSLVAARFS